MPSLDRELQRRLLGYWTNRCRGCGRFPYRDYCRQCDVFFLRCGCGHAEETEHAGHRTYPALRVFEPWEVHLLQ